MPRPAGSDVVRVGARTGYGPRVSTATTGSAVTMADVAARAGVSMATVSRALRGAPGVSEETRRRVRRLAEELAYVISPEASGLSRGATGRVAVVVHALGSWYSSTLLRSTERVLRAAGLDLLLYCVDTAADRRAFFEELPARRKVDAVVFVAVPLSDGERDRLDVMGVTAVTAGTADARYPGVHIDDDQVAQQAVNHLVSLGHRRIGLVNTVSAEGVAWPSHAERERGYRAALRAAGLGVDEDVVVSWSMGADGGAEGMDRLLSTPRLPTAVLAYSDEVAIGAIRSLRRARIAVPEQMSVVGIDDHPMAALTDLTTVRQDVDELGALSGQLVVGLLGGQPVPSPAPRPTRLVVRGTSAPPHA